MACYPKISVIDRRSGCLTRFERPPLDVPGDSLTNSPFVSVHGIWSWTRCHSVSRLCPELGPIFNCQLGQHPRNSPPDSAPIWRQVKTLAAQVNFVRHSPLHPTYWITARSVSPSTEFTGFLMGNFLRSTTCRPSPRHPCHPRHPRRTPPQQYVKYSRRCRRPPPRPVLSTVRCRHHASTATRAHPATHAGHQDALPLCGNFSNIPDTTTVRPTAFWRLKSRVKYILVNLIMYTC